MWRGNYKFIWVGLILLLGFLAGSYPILAWPALFFALALFSFFYLSQAFFLFLAFLPFQFALNPWPGVDLAAGRIFIAAIFLGWILRLFSGKEKFGVSRRSFFCLLFFIIAGLSVLAAREPFWALRKLLFLINWLPLVFLAPAVLNNSRKIKQGLRVLVGAGFFSAVIALAQFGAQFVLGQDRVIAFFSKAIAPVFWGADFGKLVVANPSWLANVGGQTVMRAIGLFPDPHLLAFFLGLSAPLALALAWLDFRWRKLFTAVFCFLSLALLATFSRGGYLGFVFGLGVFGFLGWRHFGTRAKILISSLALLLSVCFFFFQTPALTRFYSIFDFSEGSNSERLAIWRESLAQGLKNPALGVGLGNYPLVLNFNQNYRSAVTSHNLYLDLFAETGLPGLAAWIFLLGFAFWELFKKTKTFFRFSTPLAAGLFAALAYFCVHSFFETAIFNPAVFPLLLILLGFAFNLESAEKNIHDY